MVGIQIGKEQEERKREEEGLNFETTPWWNFRNHHGLCGRRAAEREFVKFVKLRAQPTAKAKAMHHIRGTFLIRERSQVEKASRDKKEDQEGN